MSTSATIQSLINYYVNLIIIQYHNKPKAQATIAAYAKMMLCSAVLLDIQQAYNIDVDLGPTAVGKQLDIIGKYVGIDRFYRVFNLIDFFSTPDYFDTPTSPPQYGFDDYADWDTSDDFNGTLTYDKIITTANTLIDQYFLTLILLKIRQNTIDHSTKSIYDTMFEFFGTDVRPEWTAPMVLAYFIENDTPLVDAVIYKKLLLKPMAVGLRIVQEITGLMFGFSDYLSGTGTPFAFGFSTYSNYDTLPGQVLVYSQITIE